MGREAAGHNADPLLIKGRKLNSHSLKILKVGHIYKVISNRYLLGIRIFSKSYEFGKESEAHQLYDRLAFKKFRKFP